MSNFWGPLFWPLLIYVVVFGILSGGNPIIAALEAGFCAALCAICMTLFITLGEFGLNWRKHWKPSFWPRPVRQITRRSLLMVVILTLGSMITGVIMGK